MFVVHLKPHWREARIDASLARSQESNDTNPGMHTDSGHRQLFFNVLLCAFLIAVLRAGAVFGSHHVVSSVGLTGLSRLCVRL